MTPAADALPDDPALLKALVLDLQAEVAGIAAANRAYEALVKALKITIAKTDMIDLRHELVKLAALIDWEFFEEEWAGFFPSHAGRPATSPRLVAGLLYLQNAYQLSDGAVVARWVENPYYQHLCGETFVGKAVHRTAF